MRTVANTAALVLVWSLRCLAQGVGGISPTSPLATDGQRLFAIATDQKTIMVRPVSLETGWQPLHLATAIGTVGGLAADGGVLFLSDSEAATIFRVDLANGTVDVLHKGKPLRRPRDLAVGKMLFVADPEAGQVFRTGTNAPAKIEPVTELAKVTNGSGTLALSLTTLVYAEDGAIMRVARATEPTTGKVEWLQERRGESARKDVVRQRSSYKGKDSHQGRDAHESKEPKEYPRIDEPISVAAINGIVYAVSGTTGLVYATPRFVRRAVNSTFGLQRGGRRSFRRIVVTDEWLFALDGEKGDVVRWERPVPTRFTPEVRLSECLSAFFQYLALHDALPAREVSLRASLEETLRAEEVLKFPYVAALDSVICNLNPDLCTAGKLPSVLPAKLRVNIPDLFAETILTYPKVVLTGKASLGQTVDASVPSPEFAYARAEEFLRRINRMPEPRGANLRDRKQGEFIGAKEIVSYVVAVPASDVPDGRPGPVFDEVRRLCRQRDCGKEATCPDPITSLERRPALKSGNGDCTTDWSALDQTRTALLGAIHFLAQASAPVDVAVVEDEVDTSHPDFSTEAGSVPFDVSESTERVARTTTAAEPQARCWSDDDHGTAVTALIGAQRWRSTAATIAGLAPAARLTLFPSDFASLGDSITASPVSPTIAVTNISRKSESDDGLLTVLKQNQQMLFVVAAGNDRQQDVELCEQTAKLVYPACYGDKVDNVLVVGATTLDGRWLESSTEVEGSNWSRKHVHVAAPGEGYWSAGKEWSYVPVRGTSFATPLVSATAARLAALNISPAWRIKYRIIATADPIPALDTKVMGGVLNVERAVTSPRQTLITRGTQTTAVFLKPAQEVKIPIDGVTQTIKLDHILRLKKRGDAYRIIYEDDSEKLQVRDGARLPANPGLTVRYNVVNPETGGPGQLASQSLNGIDDFVGALPTWSHRRM